MSLAKQAEKGNLAPGLSLKFLRDGVESANMFALVSLTGISSSEFFDQPFTNNLPMPDMGLAEKLLFKKFKQASNCPLMLGSSELALYQFNGTKESSPKFPFQMIFTPKIKLGDSQYNADTLKNLFVNYQFTNAQVFDVYAYATPADRRADNKELIATITMTSQVVTTN